MGVFPHLRPPRIFFQKSGSVTFVPLWCTNFMQKIKKILRAVSEIFKDGPRTDGRTDMGDYIGPPRVNPGSKKTKSEKGRFHTYAQPKQDFLRTCGFC